MGAVCRPLRLHHVMLTYVNDDALLAASNKGCCTLIVKTLVLFVDCFGFLFVMGQVSLLCLYSINSFWDLLWTVVLARCLRLLTRHCTFVKL